MRIIAIQNYGHSGTTLLHSLFDGHPNVLSLPSLIGIHFYDYWRRFMAMLPPDTLPDERLLAQFLWDNVTELFDPDHAYGHSLGLSSLGDDGTETACIGFDDFLSSFLTQVAKATFADPTPAGETALSRRKLRRAVLLAIYRAYAEGIGLTWNNRVFLVFPAHSCQLSDVADLLEDFHDVRFIHMVRDPVNNFDSGLKTFKRDNRKNPTLWALSPLQCCISQLMQDRALQTGNPMPLHSIVPYHPDLIEVSAAVRLEDLHHSSEEALKALARWLDLPWHEALMQSTVAGKKWWNQVALRRVSGFKKEMVTDYFETSGLDRQRMIHLSEPIRTQFKYAAKKPHRMSVALALLACALPFRVERSYRDPLRAYGLFLEHILARLAPRLTARRRAYFHQWLSDRADIAKAPMTRSTEAGNPADAEIRAARSRVGRLEWWAARIAGRVIGYWIDRRTIINAYREVRQPTVMVPLLWSGELPAPSTGRWPERGVSAMLMRCRKFLPVKSGQ